MEHLIFHLVVESIQALDRRLQKPLAKVVPEVGRLREDPAGYLAASPAVIGPRKRQALALVVGLVCGAAVVAMLYFSFRHMPRPKRPDPWRTAGIVVSFGAVTLFARALMLRWLAGATMTLRREGAELVHGGQALFLPWELFYAPGVQFAPDRKVVVLPINLGVPVAVTGSDDEVRALMPEDVALGFVECGDDGQLALKDCYEVPVEELGQLLRHVAFVLRGDRPDQPPRSMNLAPMAVAEDGGWVRIQLTQLPFPPICAGCGLVSPATVELPVLGQNRSLKLAVPFCDACQSRRKRRAWVGAGVGAAVGLLIGLAGGGILAAVANVREAWTLAVVLGLVATVPGTVVGAAVGAARSWPVVWKEYRPEKGTVRLRFRRPGDSQALMEAMGLEVEEKPELAVVAER